MQLTTDPILTLHLQLIDIIETVYRGAAKGRGLVVSPKGKPDVYWRSGSGSRSRPDYSTRYRY